MSDRYHKSGHACFMLTELYIEALLVDEELADLVWAAWDRNQITTELAGLTWSLVAATTLVPNTGRQT